MTNDMLEILIQDDLSALGGFRLKITQPKTDKELLIAEQAKNLKLCQRINELEKGLGDANAELRSRGW